MRRLIFAIPREKGWEAYYAAQLVKVKWLPTGEVFKVGDWYDRNKIKSFKVEKGECRLVHENGSSRLRSEIKKINPPILTTEDGKPFWKGDKAVFLEDHDIEHPEDIDWDWKYREWLGNSKGQILLHCPGSKRLCGKSCQKVQPG